MQTLNAVGKHGGSLVSFLKDSLKAGESELKILIDGPIQVEEIRKFLEPSGFANFMLEDDEGNLYLTTSLKDEAVKEVAATPPAHPVAAPSVPEKVSPPKNISIEMKNSTGVLIACAPGKHKQNFTRKILASLVNSKVKPEVIALMNGAVALAAYDAPTCDYLKELESAKVKILISDSCADLVGVSEAIGVGVLVDMSEIFEEIFSCAKVVSL